MAWPGRPLATIAAKARSSPPRINVMGAPWRNDSATLSSTSVVDATSKPFSWPY